MKRDPEAVALYEKGLKANPNSFYMYDELGQYYFVRAKNYPKAATYYERAVKFKDVKPQTWNALARSYEKSGKLDKALKAWEKAATYPGNPAAQHNLKRVRSLVKQRPSSQ
jgi:pentatricopeptide repeat protein